MEEVLKRLKALGDPTRLRLVALLGHGELCVCDLTAVLELPQSTVSRHLARLRNAGLVLDRKKGVWAYYRVNAELSEPIRTVLSSLAGHLRRTAQGGEDAARLGRRLASLDRCCG